MMCIARWRSLWIAFLAYKELLFLTTYPVLLLALPITVPGKPAKAAYIILLMAGYWITEVIPIYVTALIPMVLGPLLNIAPSSILSQAYMRNINMLFVGSLMFACAVEHNNLHRRLAILVLRLSGGDLKMLLLGFMGSSWFLSLWISNSATTAMMIIIAESVIVSLESKNIAPRESEENSESNILSNGANEELTSRDSFQCGNDSESCENQLLDSKNRNFRRFAAGLSLSVCYASSIGGIGTVTGTPPNSILYNVVNRRYGRKANLTFGTWMAFAIPISIVMFFITWLWIVLLYLGPRSFRRNRSCARQSQMITEIIEQQSRQLGRFTYAEGWCSGLFVVLTLLFITRDMGSFGWVELFRTGSSTINFVTDVQPAVLIALIAMVVPAVRIDKLWLSRYRNYKDPAVPLITHAQTLLPWSVAQRKFPWGVIILLGGGYAMSDICQFSGLMDEISSFLGRKFGGLPKLALLYSTSQITTCLTEFTSNAATASLLLPILFSLSSELKLHPFLLTLPATVGASFAFSLPAATAPNSIVFSNGRVKVLHMLKTGIPLNIIGNLVTFVAMVTYARPLFKLDSVPTWAINATMSRPLLSQSI